MTQSVESAPELTDQQSQPDLTGATASTTDPTDAATDTTEGTGNTKASQPVLPPVHIIVDWTYRAWDEKRESRIKSKHEWRQLNRHLTSLSNAQPNKILENDVFKHGLMTAIFFAYPSNYLDAIHADVYAELVKKFERKFKNPRERRKE